MQTDKPSWYTCITNTNSAFHPSAVGKLLGTWRSAFTCVRWQVTACDAIWQVTLRSSEMGFPWRAIPFDMRYLKKAKFLLSVAVILSSVWNFATSNTSLSSTTLPWRVLMPSMRPNFIWNSSSDQSAAHRWPKCTKLRNSWVKWSCCPFST